MPNVILLFDEAQSAYYDATLWDNVKAMQGSPNTPMIIFFASYGSVDESVITNTGSEQILFSGPAFIELFRPLPEDSGDRTPLGLLLTHEEELYITKKANETLMHLEQTQMSSTLTGFLRTLAGGHVGALPSLFSLVRMTKVRVLCSDSQGRK